MRDSYAPLKRKKRKKSSIFLCSRVFAQCLSFLLYASRKRYNWLLMFLKPSGTPVGGDQILVYFYSSLDLFAGDFKRVTFRQDPMSHVLGHPVHSALAWVLHETRGGGSKF